MVRRQTQIHNKSSKCASNIAIDTLPVSYSCIVQGRFGLNQAFGVSAGKKPRLTALNLLSCNFEKKEFLASIRLSGYVLKNTPLTLF